jgi:hypothetical protein
MVRHALKHYLTLAGALVHEEPRHCFAQGRLRPDLEVRLGDKRYFIDVSITHPTGASYAQQACNVLGAAKKREGTKNNKYAQISRDAEADFVPFIIESFVLMIGVLHRIPMRHVSKFHSDSVS